MGRGRERWGTKALRDFMPLKSEACLAPRFDGAYVSDGNTASVSFHEDGTALISGEAARWTTQSGLVRVVSELWDCEGTVGIDVLYLLCSPGGNNRGRVELELRFSQGG